MCETNWTYRNRAPVFNHYSVKTLLVDTKGFCPCGPNRPDYNLRSRLYNPDPKYQPHLDITCHSYDSIPKDKSCGGYGRPGPPGYNHGNCLPCFGCPNTGCWPDNNQCNPCCPPQCPCCPTRCRRRQIRPPCWACCKHPKTTLKQFICQMKAKDQAQFEQQLQCEQQEKEREKEEPPPQPRTEEDNYDPNCESQGGYQLEIPSARNYCGNKVAYNCGQTGNCYTRTTGGCCEIKKMTDTGSLMVEYDLCGGISSRCNQDCTCC